MILSFFFLIFIYLFWLSWAVTAVQRGLLSVAKDELLIAVAPLVQHGPWGTGSVAVGHGLSFSVAYGIFPD